MSADGLPFMGRPKRWRNVVVGAGHGMFGLTLAPPSGVAISELIMTGRSSTDISEFDPDRNPLRRRKRGRLKVPKRRLKHQGCVHYLRPNANHSRAACTVAMKL